MKGFCSENPVKTVEIKLFSLEISKNTLEVQIFTVRTETPERRTYLVIISLC